MLNWATLLLSLSFCFSDYTEKYTTSKLWEEKWAHRVHARYAKRVRLEKKIIKPLIICSSGSTVESRADMWDVWSVCCCATDNKYHTIEVPFDLQVCRHHCCPLGGGDVSLYGEVPMLQMVMIQYFKHSQIHQLSVELNRMLWCNERLVMQTTETCHVRDNVGIELKSVTHQVPLFWGWTTWWLCLLPTLSFLGYLISSVCCSIDVPCYILNVTNLFTSSLKHCARA